MSEDQVLFESTRFRVLRRKYRSADGQQRQRDLVDHPGAVTIIPLLDDGRVCLIRNIRPTVGETLLELPAGTLEPGEDPRVTAERELAEETGYRAQSFEKIAEFYTSPGVLNERMHLYIARGLTPGEKDLDEGEEIQNHPVDWPEALRLIRTGQIRDGKTLAGLLLYGDRRSGEGTQGK